jgi:hypothetical protein
MVAPLFVLTAIARSCRRRLLRVRAAAAGTTAFVAVETGEATAGSLHTDAIKRCSIGTRRPDDA